MMSQIRLVVEPYAGSDVRGILNENIALYNVAATGAADYFPLALFLRNEDNEPLGGLLGQMWGGWLYIETFWIARLLRGAGYGSQLIGKAEEIARARGCTQVYLDTFSFQAPAFYQKHGYEIFATLQDFPPGHQKYFLKKRLVPEDDYHDA